jgi:hypothetical protein
LLTRLWPRDSVAAWTPTFGELRARELPAGMPASVPVKPLVSTLPKVACVMFRPDRLLSHAATSCKTGTAQESIASIFCFSIDVVPDPGTMARVLEQFAKRGLVPTRWHSDVIESDVMQIDIQIIGLSATLGQDIARCLGSIVGVHGVLTASKTAPVDRRLRPL